MLNFFEHGSAVMEAVDHKYRYRFERPEGITWEQWESVRVDVESKIGTIMENIGINFNSYEENLQHTIIQEICYRLKIDSYSRRRL